jgi:hypothetical protein
MSWVLVVGTGWLVVGTIVALLIGFSIRLADAKALGRQPTPHGNFVVDPLKAADAEIAEASPTAATAVVPAPAAPVDPPAHAPAMHASHSKAATPPVIGGCVPSTERAPASREPGLI